MGVGYFSEQVALNVKTVTGPSAEKAQDGARIYALWKKEAAAGEARRNLNKARIFNSAIQEQQLRSGGEVWIIEQARGLVSLLAVPVKRLSVEAYRGLVGPTTLALTRTKKKEGSAQQRLLFHAANVGVGPTPSVTGGVTADAHPKAVGARLLLPSLGKKTTPTVGQPRQGRVTAPQAARVPRIAEALTQFHPTGSKLAKSFGPKVSTAPKEPQPLVEVTHLPAVVTSGLLKQAMATSSEALVHNLKALGLLADLEPTDEGLAQALNFVAFVLATYSENTEVGVINNARTFIPLEELGAALAGNSTAEQDADTLILLDLIPNNAVEFGWAEGRSAPLGRLCLAYRRLVDGLATANQNLGYREHAGDIRPRAGKHIARRLRLDT